MRKKNHSATYNFLTFATFLVHIHVHVYICHNQDTIKSCTCTSKVKRGKKMSDKNGIMYLLNSSCQPL